MSTISAVATWSPRPCSSAPGRRRSGTSPECTGQGGGQMRGHWLHSPILHFVVIGGLLFTLRAGWRARHDTPELTRAPVMLTAQQVGQLQADFVRQWGGPPTSAQLQALIQETVDAELLYREAVRLGLDDDLVIKRLLRQKMRLLLQQDPHTAPLQEQDIRDHIARHRDRFMRPEAVTFSHVFLSAGRRGERLKEEAEALLVRLRSQ